MAFKLSTIVALCSLLASIYATPDGATDKSCQNLLPQHGVDAKTGPAPYTLTLSKNAIRSGDSVEVTIRGKTTNDKVQGFLMQARDGQTIIGKFLVPANNGFMKTIDCKPGSANSLTHVKHPETEDKQSFTAKWIAPKDYKGKVTFVATIAKKWDMFWAAVPSHPLTVN